MDLKKKATDAKAVDPKKESSYTKDQLLSSKRFREKKDILNALISEKEQYTIKATEQIINNFLKGQVK